MSSCKFCSAFGHKIDECGSIELAKLCSSYLNYQYKSTVEFETYIRSLSYPKFYGTAYFCMGYNDADIHPTNKKNIVKRMIDLHIFTQNTQNLNRMTWRHIQTPPIIINVHTNTTTDGLLLIEGDQIDMIKLMDHTQIKDMIYLLSRGHNPDTIFSQYHPQREESMIDDAIEGLLNIQNTETENLTMSEILGMNKIIWTTHNNLYNTIDCPICWTNTNNICKYNCSHCFCHDCTCKTISTGNIKCSLCRTNIQNIQHYV